MCHSLHLTAYTEVLFGSISKVHSINISVAVFEVISFICHTQVQDVINKNFDTYKLSVSQVANKALLFHQVAVQVFNAEFE
jgi:hypothetical protein